MRRIFAQWSGSVRVQGFVGDCLRRRMRLKENCSSVGVTLTMRPAFELLTESIDSRPVDAQVLRTTNL
jgi:hypothetical protein